MKTCLHKGVDEGCIEGTSLCTSPNGRLFAAGSESGIVNVSNGDDFLDGKRKPMKTPLLLVDVSRPLVMLAGKASPYKLHHYQHA